MTFQNFITTFYPWYSIDEDNHEVIKLLDLWARREQSFEEHESCGYNLYLDKGILIMGTVGSGKTDTIRILKNYLKHIRSPYIFNETTVQKVVETFQTSGGDFFYNFSRNHWFFDELALLDNVDYTNPSPRVTHEVCNYYGNKCLMGTKIIENRYSSFKFEGGITLFTTNSNEEQLQNIYGLRPYDRLLEICNFFSMVRKESRRKNRRPNVTSIELDEAAYRAKSANRIESLYSQFLKNNYTEEINFYDYEILFKVLGYAMIKEVYDRVCVEVYEDRKKEVNNIKPVTKADHNEKKRLIAIYSAQQITDQDERALLMGRIKVKTVIEHFKIEKEKNKTKVLEIS